MTHAKYALVGRHTVVHHLLQSLTVRERLAISVLLIFLYTFIWYVVLALNSLAILISVLLGTTPLPPGVVAAIAVDSAFTRYGYVLCLVGIDAGRVVDAVQSLPTCYDVRI